MALTDKDRDYINALRRSIEKKERRNIGFNTQQTNGTDAGLDFLDNMTESEEVRNEGQTVASNENIPFAEIFDDNEDILPRRTPVKKDKPRPASNKFDNTTSIAVDEGISYDESMLGFDAGDEAFSDANAPVVDSAMPDIDDAADASNDDNVVRTRDVLESFGQIRDDYGDKQEVVISIDGVDIPITGVDVDAPNNRIRITCTMNDEDI